jgi:hypothetical protein
MSVEVQELYGEPLKLAATALLAMVLEPEVNAAAEENQMYMSILVLVALTL